MERTLSIAPVDFPSKTYIHAHMVGRGFPSEEREKWEREDI